jgi:hypothetical protein
MAMRSFLGLRRRRRGRHVALVLATCAIATSAAACDLHAGRDNDRVGVSRTEAGTILILFGLCPKELVTHVDLQAVVGDIVADEDDRVLSIVESDPGARLEQFAVGNTPTGFVQKVASAGCLQMRRSSAHS